VQIASLRKALALAPGGENWIVTIPRIGYRFVGPALAAPTPVAAASYLPSLAVLPFANLGIDPEQNFFADGLAEDVITTLSKVSGLLVISATSSFAYRGTTIDLRRVAQELGVRYVLEGSVRRSGQRVRLAVRLVDARSGGQVWADRYDRDLDDVFAV